MPRADNDKKAIDEAKALLMKQMGMKEADAYRVIQKTSRNKRKSMVEVANAILVLHSMEKK